MAVGLYAIGSSAEAAPKASAFGSPSKDCFLAPDKVIDLDALPPSDRAVDAAATCEDVALNKRGGRDVENSYARFYAAKASRIKYERLPVADPESELLKQAARQVTAASTANPRLVQGRLELARIHRLQGKFDLADQELSDVSGAIADNSGVLFERAMATIGKAERAGVVENREAAQSARVTALGYLRNIRPQDAYGDQYVRFRAPLALAKLANDLGEGVMKNLPPTIGNVEQAQSRFVDARGAVEQLRGQPGWDAEWQKLSPRIYFNFGRAQLRMAGLLRDAGSDAPDCTRPLDRPANDQSMQALSQAESSFAPLGESGDSAWGMGCVKLARSEFPAALQYFQKAIQQPSPNSALEPWDLYVGRARASAALGRIQEASADYELALTKSPPGSTASRVQMELAQTLTRAGRKQEALDRISKVLQTPASSKDRYDPKYDPAPFRSGEAYLQRALIWVPGLTASAGPISVPAGSDVYHARLNLEAASKLPGTAPGRAAYMLSLLEQNQGRGTAAVLAADDAALADRDRAEYRRQACLMRIRFWTSLDATLRERGALHCAAGPSTSSFDGAEQLLYQGMFHMRGTFSSTGGLQQRAWSDALNAFTRGTQQLGEPRDDRERKLRARLARGQNNALYCSGLGTAAGSIVATRGEAEDAGNAKQFFEDYDLDLCARRIP